MEQIAAALVDALTDLTNIAKKNQANTGSYGYSFLNIADLVAETRPVLAEHGIVALTPIADHGNGLACTVVLLHRSGERLDFGPFPFPHGKDAQATGSWVTYTRRYALLSALGMGAEDDDGKSAQPAPRQQARPQERATESMTEKAAYNALISHLAGAGKDEQDAVALAASLWSELKPKAVDGVLADREWKRIVTHADERLALTQ